MDIGSKILSELTIFTKYAKYLPKENRRESWEEICARYQDMMIKKYPMLTTEICANMGMIYQKKVLPSMRALQFAGSAIDKAPNRIYNCGYLPIDSLHSFSEIMFLLLGGTGIGYSVQFHHIEQLPEINKSTKNRRFLIGDSIEGWADAVKVLINSYFGKGSKPIFDYSDIRPKGARLITAGGKAPGPEPIHTCLFHIETILERKVNGQKLSTLEAHDIVCHIANAVLAGGIRRAALLSLFSFDDQEMLTCKFGNWWELNEQRGRANNSAVIKRDRITKEEFDIFWDKIKASNAGEPGIYFTNNIDLGTNPCVIGETEVITKDGYTRIDSLVNKEVEIWNGFEWSLVTPTITGINQHVIKVTLSDGRELTSTDYHSWYLADGYTGKSIKVQTKDLKIGDKLIKYNFPILNKGTSVSFKHAYTQGFISAEGMDDYKFFWLYEPKYMCLQRLDIKLAGSEFKNINGIGRTPIYYNDVYEEKSYIPFEWDINCKLQWLSGLFDGDATELVEGGLQIASVNISFLRELQKFISTLGINSKIVFGNKAGLRSLPDGKGGIKDYLCKETNRICIGAIQIQELITLGLNCERLKFNKTPQRDASQFVKVIKIEDIGYVDEVYCFNEPKRHLGIFNGIITGQCVEISLKAHQFCNLCDINVSDISTQEEYEKRVKVATFFGTLQAGFTDFHYLRDSWKKTTEKEALIGIGMTGIASGSILSLNMRSAVKTLLIENQRVSNSIDINKAARTSTVKPSGTTSCVLGCSSGIHAWHDKYYLRTIRFNKNEAIVTYLKIHHPYLLEDDLLRPHDTVCVRIPIKAPKNAILRSESSLELLERVKKVSSEWVKPGHVKGDNTHNVSVTVNLKEDEWETTKDWLWKNKEIYNGISILPYDGHTYKQAPFESITEEEYNKRIQELQDIDLTKVVEMDDFTDLKGELACAGPDGCEIK